MQQAIDAITLIEASSSAKALFATHAYRQLALACHPDQWMTATPTAQKRAANAFIKLQKLHNGKPVATPVVFGSWVVEKPITAGDLADVYQVASANTPKAVLKIVRNQADNDLIDAEIASLRHLHADPPGSFQRYVPCILDTFKASGRRAVITTIAEGLSLAEILKHGKLDFRHAVWMSNRLLSALGYIHQRGIVHGAILPPHLIYGPESHGLTVVDWCYSVTGESRKPVPAVVNDYERLYPHEILNKTPPSPSTDIYMWAMIVKEIAIVPRRFNGILEWCTAHSPRLRPTDAWAVLDNLCALAKTEYGDPKYVPLEVSK